MKQKLYKPIFIDGKKSRYGIANDGDIISFNYGNTKKIKHLKLQTDKYGYKTIHLRMDGKSYKYIVSRLVAMYYIPIPKRYLKRGYSMKDLEVNHKDCNKLNNYYKNLEWCTTKENVLHAEKHNLRHHFSGESHPMSKHKEKDIRKVCKLLVKNELTIKQISEKTGVSFSTVYGIYAGTDWTSISKDYDFSHYNVKSDRRTNCPLKKYNESKIREVCRLIESGDYTMKEIERITGVSNGLIQSIKYKRLYTDISKDYTFKIRKGNYKK